MKNFTLTLYAKRRSDGTYEYSLNVWGENRASGTVATAASFESHASLSQQDAVLPIGKGTNFIPSEAECMGDYWFPFTMPMSDAQAANLGWLAEAPLERDQVN